MASEDEQCQAVVKAMTVSKAEDVRKELELMMKPYADWEEYLSPAPLSIAVLGNLIYISSGQGDFSINKKPPREGFKHIKYPQSFRACLCQVSNEGWHAFNEAHVSMDQIRLLTASIPGRIKVIDNILFQDVQGIDALLQEQVKSLNCMAEKCKSQAVAVKDKFASVISLIHELLEACKSSRLGHEEELEGVETAIKQTKIKEKAAQETKTLADKYHNQLKQQTEDLFEEYKKNMEEIPTGWKAVGMAVVESIGKTIPNSVATVFNLLGKLLKRMWKAAGKEKSAAESRFETIEHEISFCSESSSVLYYAVQLMENVIKQDGLLNLDNVYDQKKEEFKTDWAKNGFLKVKSKIEEKSYCHLKKQVLDLCNSGVLICEKLEEIVKSYQEGTEEERVIIDEIKQLHQQASAFDSIRQDILNSSLILLNTAKYQQETTGGSSAMRNSYVKVEQSREMLKQAQEVYQRSFDELKQQNQEMTNLLCEMESFKIKKISFEKALQMLTKGLEAMGKVKAQWEMMIKFFEMMSNLMNICLDEKINDFIGFISYGHKTGIMKDLIYDKVCSASSVAHLVHMIAETYSEVSHKYLMNQVSSLGMLIALEPSNPEIEAQRNALNQGCKETQDAILSMVKEKKEEYDRNVEARLETIDTELKAVLSLTSMEEKKMIRDAVRQGMQELTPEEEDQFA